MSIASTTITAETLQRWAADPMRFFEDTVIPAGGVDGRLGDVWAGFQRDAFQVMADCLKAVGAGRKPPKRGLWIERTKGASKDSDVGLALLWLLMFSRRPQVIELGADDLEQILETYKAMAAIIRCNPWMNDRLIIRANKILCEATASTCDFLTRDASGSHGSRPTVTVCNELSHCQSEEFISTMMDNADKVPNNLAIIATNAGELESWQHRWRENYRVDADWYFQKVATVAPWIDPKKVADAKRRNSASRYARLWQGQWVSSSGDALPTELIEKSITLPGPIMERQPDEGCILGLDLGVKRDHSAVVVLLTDHYQRRIKLAWCESWAPYSGLGGQVDLGKVWESILWARKQYNVNIMHYDPWQAEFIAQKARIEGMMAEPMSFSGQGATLMASTLLEVFRSEVLDLYPDELLLRDLGKLSIVETANGGYKLTAPRDEFGHADRAMAMAIALPTAWQGIGEVVYIKTSQLPQTPPGQWPGRWLN